ncbi:MAG: LytR C-terminal domain-containing protein [Calditrichaeota bacterium]|nr:LytR C-terminal domain-containing protein [Calditrichota bacterium]
MVQRKYRQSSNKHSKSRSAGAYGNSGGFFWSFGIGVLVLLNIVLIGSAAYKFAFKEKKVTRPPSAAVVQKKAVAPEVSVPASRKIRVELLNGCGVPGLAMSFSNYLRRNGFDVVDTKNYSSFNVRNTLVIDRTSKKLKNAKRVAQVLGIKHAYIQPKMNPDLQVEVTVILGADFTKLKGFNQIGKD